ncbi:MAG: hypothetical protein Q4G51_03350 [Dermatophilus congolensis]|nr:hypothetical protein [Dermatophilus congolensis]
MVFGDFLSRIGGNRPQEAAPVEQSSGPPTGDTLRAALDHTEELVTGGSVPSTVTARVLRVTAAVRDTLPRLDQLGAGSASAYNVMATATDYLPDAVNGYLRLPRRFADTRPVDGGRTSLMVLVDQLDLLGATMDRVFDAVYRSDANALVAHGRFLQEKFGRGTTAATGNLVIGEGETSVPAPAPAAGDGPGAGAASAPAEMPNATEPSSTQADSVAPESVAGSDQPESPGPLAPPTPTATPAPTAPEPRETSHTPAPDEPQRLRPPSSLDL